MVTVDDGHFVDQYLRVAQVRLERSLHHQAHTSCDASFSLHELWLSSLRRFVYFYGGTLIIAELVDTGLEDDQCRSFPVSQQTLLVACDNIIDEVIDNSRSIK